MTELTHFQAGDSSEDMLACIRADGACIVDSLIPAETVARLRGETDPHMEATRNGQDDFTGRSTTRTGGLVLRSPTSRDLIQHPEILALCDGFLLEYCERYQLHLGQIIRIRPGEKAQKIHRDRWAWGTHLAHVEPQLNTIWALTDFTAENGATQVVPGSTRWEDNRKIEPQEIASAKMTLGSVLLYTGSVFHGGGRNQSTQDRIGLNITYALGWLRQEENQYLSTPPDQARELNSDLQKLIGYSMGQYALGYFTPPGRAGEPANIADPQDAVKAGTGTLEGIGSTDSYQNLSNRVQQASDK